MAALESLVGRVAGQALAKLTGRAARAFRTRPLAENPPTMLAPRVADVTFDDLDAEEVVGVRRYLESPDFEVLAAQLLVANAHGVRTYKKILSAVREQLRLGLRHAAGLSGDRILRVTDAVQDALHIACVNEAIRPANPMLDSVRGVATAAHLATQAAQNGRLLARIKEVGTVHELAHRLCEQVRSQHELMRLPHPGSIRSVAWADLYVRPALAAEREHEPEPSFDDLLETGARTVVLGDPGGGKSTLLSKLAHDTATEGALVPFQVVLRDAVHALDQGGRRLTEHISAFAQEVYHVEVDVQSVEYLLGNGRAVLLLDGLDELTDPALRNRVVSMVNGFATAFPLTPVVVTARQIGYGDAPLRSDLFRVIKVAPFDRPRIEAYARNWFALEETASADLADGFLRESETIDLRGNALLLSLLCSLYANERYLPRNLADVYQKCAVLMFERWDASRGIGARVPFQGRLRNAVQYLAWELFANEERSHLPRRDMVRILVKFLSGKAIDPDEAEVLAESFMDYCTGRAWILTELGSTSTEPVYGFAHRTFLEFFAAEHLVRIRPSPEDLWPVLRPRLDDSGWVVVGQLALQLLDRNRDDGADGLLRLALTEPSEAGLAFLARALGHVVPAPAIVDEVVTLCTLRAVAVDIGGRTKLYVDSNDWHRWGLAHTPYYDALYGCLDENLPYVSRAVTSRLTELAVSGHDSAQLLAHNLGRGLNVADERRRAFWTKASDDLVAGHGRLFGAWAERQPWQRLEHCASPEEAYELVDRFGPRSVYATVYLMAGGTFPAAIEYLCAWSRDDTVIDLSAGPSSPIVHGIRDALVEQPVPWLSKNEWGWSGTAANGSDVEYMIDRFRQAVWPIAGTNLATFLVIYLPYLEAGLRPIPQTEAEVGKIAAIRLLGQRSGQNPPTDLTELDLPEPCVSLLSRWAAGEVSVVGSPAG